MTPKRTKNSFLIRLIAVSVLVSVATSASAGITRKAIGGTAILLSGAAIYSHLQKGCQQVRDIETGQVRYYCDKTKPGPIAQLKASTTKDLRKALNLEQRSTGQPEDPNGCDAHHIVPKSEMRPWARKYANDARQAIAGCVEIESAANGVYLPGQNKGPSQCKGSYHKTLHTREYYLDIANRLQAARGNSGCSGVKKMLEKIKNDLVQGSL